MKKCSVLLLCLLTNVILHTSCSNKFLLKSLSYEAVEVSNKSYSTEDSTLLSIIKPYKIKLDSEMMRVIATAAIDIELGLPEGLLNNYISDIVFDNIKKNAEKLNIPQPDMCILNNGGLRTSINKGNITIGNIYELMPFDNEAVVIDLKGTKVIEIFEYLAKNGGGAVSGIKMGIDKNSKPLNPLVNGKAIEKEKIYSVVTSDYLANGGDNMFFFKEPNKRINTCKKIREIILESFIETGKTNQVIHPQFDNRLYFSE